MTNQIDIKFSTELINKCLKVGDEITLTYGQSKKEFGLFNGFDKGFFVFRPSCKDNFHIPLNEIKTINPIKKSSHFTNPKDRFDIRPYICCLNEVILNNGNSYKYLISYDKNDMTFRNIDGTTYTETIEPEKIIYINN